jgi:hypothetical protein
MANHPNSSFPLLESDQAEVIRLFLDLMCKGHHAEGVSEAATTKKPVGPSRNSND